MAKSKASGSKNTPKKSGSMLGDTIKWAATRPRAHSKRHPLKPAKKK